VPWLRRLVAGLPAQRLRFDPGSVHVGFVVDKVALGQALPRVLRSSPANFTPPVLRVTRKNEKLIIFITGLHNKPQGCGASVASAAGPGTAHEKMGHQTGVDRFLGLVRDEENSGNSTVSEIWIPI
jgi:hypothetical protein